MKKRALNFAESARKASIRKIRRKNIEVIKAGTRGRNTLRLNIDQQGFQIGDMGAFTLRECRWMSTQLAIALHRFKFGD